MPVRKKGEQMEVQNKPKEPLFHITKRKELSWQSAWGIRIIAILAALVVCGIITTLTTGLNPFQVYATMFSGAFGTSRRIWILGKDVAILLCVSHLLSLRLSACASGTWAERGRS